jgi:GTP-binding protein LepA
VADTRVGDTITDDRGARPPSRCPASAGAAGGVLRPVSGRRRRLRGSARRHGQAAPQRRQLLLRDGDLAALGFGFRCGFLGLLHLEIIQERLEREFNLDLIATAPSVIYKMTLTDGDEIEMHNPVDMPDVVQIEEIEEPWIEATILTPDEYLGASEALPGPARHPEELTYVGSRAMVKYDLPLNEVVFDFYDRLKSVSKGYASFDYHLTDYRPGDLVKMQILVNAEPVDALSMLVHRTRAPRSAAAPCARSSRS